MDRLRPPPQVHASLEDYVTSAFNTWVRNLLNIQSAHSQQLAELENSIASGAAYFDNFNRTDSPTLGGGWTQGGTGPGLGIIDFAARLEPDLTAGREYAIAPVTMEDDNHGVTVVVNPGGVARGAMTTLMVRANASLTEFVYANIYGGAVYLGRGTRSGDTWDFDDWTRDTGYVIQESDVIQVYPVDDNYKLIVNNKIILEHDDVSGYPVDSSHRKVAFAQELRFVNLIPQFSWGVASFSARAGLTDFAALSADVATAVSDSSAAVATANAKPNYTDIPIDQLSVSIADTEDLSIPRAALTYGAGSGTASGGGSGGTHSHNLSQPPDYQPAGGGNDFLELTAVRSRFDRHYTYLLFATGNSNTFAGIAAAYVSVFSMSKITGDITNVTPTLSTTDIKSLITTQNKVFKLSLGSEDFDAAQGDIWFVGLIQQTGVGQNCASLLATTATLITNPGGEFPQFAYGYQDRTSLTPKMPLSLTESQINYSSSRKTPFVGLG